MFVPNKTFSFPCSNLLFGASSQPCVWRSRSSCSFNVSWVGPVKERGGFYFGFEFPQELYRVLFYLTTGITTIRNRQQDLVFLAVLG
jgi:hypothetical protein